jgi:GTPase involved in cell partitioning and DNA repair
MATPEVSHGRGGAGNFNPDDTRYGDGEVVRVGVEGSHGDGAYSSGRGGAGNISDVGLPATVRKDQDVVPESVVRPSQEQYDYHTGRGGAGNEHLAIDHEKKAAEKQLAAGSGPISVADKLKSKLFGSFGSKK